MPQKHRPERAFHDTLYLREIPIPGVAAKSSCPGPLSNIFSQAVEKAAAFVVIRGCRMPDEQKDEADRTRPRTDRSAG